VAVKHLYKETEKAIKPRDVKLVPPVNTSRLTLTTQLQSSAGRLSSGGIFLPDWLYAALKQKANSEAF
jgi:hypothetical protein